MKHLSALGLAFALALIAGAVQAQSGWTSLFDGKSLAGWTRTGQANWSVADGVIQATQGNGMLVTPASYGDFEITLEFWVSADANSGVFIRCSDPARISASNAYEVNIFDKRPDPAYRTGAIVDVAKPAVAIDAGGHWNTYQITAKGRRLTVVLNGKQTVDVEDAKHAAGPIALQYGSGVVKFRNIKIRRL